MAWDPRSEVTEAAKVAETAAKTAMGPWDATQQALLAEECILVNEQDNEIGSATKGLCHRMPGWRRHRAFSVFLFDETGRLLLQQRAACKITFPLRWSNTCCSHPLATAQERVREDALGVRRAAVRKLGHELGIAGVDVPLEGFHCVARISYCAVCDDPHWGESELDYILFLQVPAPRLCLNTNEVRDVRYLRREDLAAELRREDLSPWFRAIAVSLLPVWWDALLTRGPAGLPACDLSDAANIVLMGTL